MHDPDRAVFRLHVLSAFVPEFRKWKKWVVLMVSILTFALYCSASDFKLRSRSTMSSECKSWRDVTAMCKQVAIELKSEKVVPMIAVPGFSLSDSMSAVEVLCP